MEREHGSGGIKVGIHSRTPFHPLQLLSNGRRDELTGIYLEFADRFFEGEPEKGPTTKKQPDYNQALSFYQQALFYNTNALIHMMHGVANPQVGQSLDAANRTAEQSGVDRAIGLVAPAEIVIEDPGGLPGAGVIGGGAQGEDLHQGTPFVDRVRIGDGARHLPPEEDNPADPAGGDELHLDPVLAKGADLLVEDAAGLPVDLRVFMAQDEGPLLLAHREDPGKERHFAGTDVDPFPQRLHHSPAGEFLQPVAEHQEMGELARERRPLEVAAMPRAPMTPPATLA